jgi:hypothetical protein
MKSVQIVAPEYIHTIWDDVKSMLKPAFINFENADYDVEHLKVLIIEQYQYLFVVVEDKKIIGAFTVEVFNQPNHRIAHTTCMGGKGLFNSDTVKQYEDWAKLQGVTKIRAYAKDSQARLFKMKLGLEMVTNVVEKTL